MRRKIITSVALESESKEVETEIVVYAKISNFTGLEQADEIEEHYQVESRFYDGTRCRIRRVGSVDTDMTYTFTIKVPHNDDGDGLEANTEYSHAVDEEFFNGFLKVCDRRMQKTRFVFYATQVQMQLGDDVVELPKVKYEVDVYKDRDGKTIEWCKIDIEVDELLINAGRHTDVPLKLQVKLSHLPFKPISPLLGDSDDAGTQDAIAKLWERYLLP